MLAAQAKVLPASTALLIARIPDPKLALKATAEILGLNAKDEAGLVKELKEKISKPDDYHWWSPMSFRKAKHHVAASYTKRLKGCGFDPEDALLVVAAGACSACPFRSGNLKDLKPADLGGTDVCTNPACYRAKVDATQRAQDAALKARTGAAKIVTASAAGLTTDYVKGHATTVQRPGEYLALHAKPDGKNKSFEELLDVDDVEKFVSRDPNDARKHHVLVRVADVAPQLKELKLPVPQPEAKAGPRDHAAEQKEREQRQAEAQVFLDTLRPRVTKALLKVKPEKLLLYHILEHCRPNAKETALLKKMKLDQLVRVLVPWHGKVLYGDEIARGDVAVAKLAGIDLVAEVKGYRKEQAKAAAAKVK